MKKILAYYKGWNATKATKEEADNLCLNIYIYIRA